MNTFIATFYSHFGAVKFKKLCSDVAWDARLMPVPRDLSSSCGTCVRYEGEQFCPCDTVPEEIELIVSVGAEGYEILYKAEDS